MKDQEQLNYLVVKENDLVQRAQYRLNAGEQKLVCYVISRIKPTDTRLDDQTIRILDFADITGVDKRHAYRDFVSMINGIDKKAQWIKMGDEVFKFRWFSEAKYNERKGTITVRLHSQLQRYLIDLRRNFTQYELWNILSLKSKYSIRMYELLRSYQFQSQHRFDIDELKTLLSAENYTTFKDFRRRVLDVAVKEINQYTDLEVTAKFESAGREHRVKGVSFDIKRKKQSAAYKAYLQTVERINKRSHQIEGQMSLFDLTKEDFDVDVVNVIPDKVEVCDYSSNIELTGPDNSKKTCESQVTHIVNEDDLHYDD